MSQFPIVRESVSNVETPKTTVQVEGYFRKNPSWRFALADTDHPKWSVRETHEYILTDPEDPTGTRIEHTFSKSVDNELVEGLKARETMTWSQILTQTGGRGKNGGTNSHFIPIYKLSKEARIRARQINITELEDELLSLRITATKRIFGILQEDGVLSVIWFDRNHEICPATSRQ